MASTRTYLGLGALVLSLTPTIALAGPPEILQGIVVHPTDPSVMVLLYQNVLGGLFYSADGGRTFSIRPSTTFTPSGLRDETQLAFGGDALLIASSDGLFKTDRQGCAISNPLQNVFVDAVATDPVDPGVAYFATSRANNGSRTGLWKRSATGAITPLGAAESGVVVTAMQAVGTRLLQTATRSGDGGTGSVLRISDDYGTTWREQPISGLGTPRLLAVDPLDSQRVVVALINAKAVDPILVTLDGGASWKSYLDGVLSAGQATVAPDGRLWLSDQGDDELTTKTGGLWSATRIGATPEQQLSEIGVTCLSYDRTADQVWLCQEYELDRFDPASRGLCRVFTMTDLASFVECSNEDLALSPRAQQQLCSGYCGALHFAEAKLCDVYNDPYGLCGPPAVYYDQKAEWVDPAGSRDRCVLAPLVMDAGVPDAAVAQDAGLSNAIDAGTPQKKNDDGCALPSSSSSLQGDVGSALLAMLVALRRRRRR